MNSALYQLTRRCVKLFLKDRMTVFFSLLAPLIVLCLYILFIGRLQVDGLTAALEQAGATADRQARAFCDSWMLAGVMAVACITVSFTACTVRVRDYERGVTADVLASPVPRWTVTLSYFLANAVITLCICLAVLGVCCVWLAASGSWYLSAGDFFGVIGVTALSVLSATMFNLFVTSFIKTESALSAFIGLLSAAIGFLIGAYMPVSTFPKAIQYFTLFIPGSYSAGLFRHFFMGGALDELAKTVPAAFADELARDYSMTYDFFGAEVGAGCMAVVLAGSVLLFAALNLLVGFTGRRTYVSLKNTKKRKKL